MSDSGSNGTANHGQEQTSDRQRDGDGDGGGDGALGIRRAAIEAEDHQDGRGDGGQSRVRCDGSADVGPAEGHELQRAAQHNALGEVTGHKSDQGAGHQRLVELELIEDALHAGQQGDDDDEQNRDWVHDPSS